jgi:DNA-binding MarR family transcriptional regulator
MSSDAAMTKLEELSAWRKREFSDGLPQLTDLSKISQTITSVWEKAEDISDDDGLYEKSRETILVSFIDALNRDDRFRLRWLNEKLTALSEFLFPVRARKKITEKHYFSIYIRALSDTSFFLSHDTDKLESIDAAASGSKHLYMLMQILYEQNSPIIAKKLAERLGLQPNSLTICLSQAQQLGVVNCENAGRRKLCTLTRLGNRYVEAKQKEVGHLVAVQLIEKYYREYDEEKLPNLNLLYRDKDVAGLIEATKRIEQQQQKIEKIRGDLKNHSFWLLSIHGNQPEKYEVFKEILVGYEEKKDQQPTENWSYSCTIKSMSEPYIFFECKRHTIDSDSMEFEVPFKFLLEKKIKIKALEG